MKYVIFIFLWIYSCNLFAYNFNIGPYINFQVPSIFDYSSESTVVNGISMTAHTFTTSSSSIYSTIIVIPLNSIPSTSFSGLTSTYVNYEMLESYLQSILGYLELSGIQGFISGSSIFSLSDKSVSTFETGFSDDGSIYTAASSSTLTYEYPSGYGYDSTLRENYYVLIGFDGYNVIFASASIDQYATNYEVYEYNSLISSFTSSYMLNPLSDSDGDGIINRDELILHGTNPYIQDTNSNGLTDYEELQLRLGNTTLTELGFSNNPSNSQELEDAKVEGRSEVINNPNEFGLYTHSQYHALLAERDARPTQEAHDTIQASIDSMLSYEVPSIDLNDALVNYMGYTYDETDGVYKGGSTSGKETYLSNYRSILDQGPMSEEQKNDLVNFVRELLNQKTSREFWKADSLYYRKKRLQALAERDAKLSLEEVRDLRAGSTMIEIHSGQATLTMEVEESDDLGGWNNGSTTSIQIPIDAEAGKKFFRFKMVE